MKSYLFLLVPLLLTACGNDEEDLAQWMQHSRQNMKGQIEPLPPPMPYTPAEYTAQALLAPFNGYRLQLARQSARGALPDSGRSRELLENYELDKLSLVGTVKLKKGMLGLIRTPDAGIQQIRVGGFIGTNYGIVRKITEHELLLEETVEDINGEWIKQENQLYLQPEQGKKP